MTAGGKMFGEEREDERELIGRGELRSAVAGALDDVERHLRAGGLELVGEALALVERHERILRALHDEQRRGILRHPRHRAAAFRELEMLRDRSAEKLRED